MADSAPILDVVNARTDTAFGRPHPALTGAVTGYIGYEMTGFSPGMHRGLPTRNLTFIVSLADPVEMKLPSSRYGRIDRHQAFVAGLDTAPAHIHHDGNQFGIAIETTPFGASRLFGLPPVELTGLVVDLHDLFGSTDALTLPDRLRAAPDWTARFEMLDTLLTTRLDAARDVPDDVVWAWNELGAAPGAHAVDAMARELGWSRRHFSARFKQHVGLSPRQFQRVARFERSKHLIVSGHATSDVITAAGYYDHAHLLHEWNKLAGCRPTEWQAEELPSVQDTSGPDHEDGVHD